MSSTQWSYLFKHLNIPAKNLYKKQGVLAISVTAILFYDIISVINIILGNVMPDLFMTAKQ